LENIKTASEAVDLIAKKNYYLRFSPCWNHRFFFKKDAGVVTTCAHAHYIVTEYGVVFLYGKYARKRKKIQSLLHVPIIDKCWKENHLRGLSTCNFLLNEAGI
jgi:hypothetical protein